MTSIIDVEIGEVNDENEVLKRPGVGLYNIISIEELSEGYFDNLGIQIEPVPEAIMMEASQPIMSLQEGIIVEANGSDDDEGLEQIVSRLKKGKWVKKETSTVIDLPNGITHEETVIIK